MAAAHAQASATVLETDHPMQNQIKPGHRQVSPQEHLIVLNKLDNFYAFQPVFLGAFAKLLLYFGQMLPSNYSFYLQRLFCTSLLCSNGLKRW